MPDISHPHDKFFKETFSHPDVAHDFLLHSLPPPLQKTLDLSTLSLTKDSFVDHSLQEQFSDLLYHARLRDRQDAYVYLLFEHKSYPEPLIAFHLLRYMVKIWEKDLKEEPRSPLRPIVPLVVYQGQSGWIVPLEFLALFPTATELRPYIPNFRYELYDLGRIPDEEMKGGAHLRLSLLLMKYILHREFKRHLAGILELFQILPAEKNRSDIFVTVIQYILNGTDTITFDELAQEVEAQLTQKGGPSMYTIADQLLDKGRMEGIEKGIQKGIQKGILEVLDTRFGPVSEELTQSLSGVQQDEALRQLLRLAAMVPSLEVFQEKLGACH